MVFDILVVVFFSCLLCLAGDIGGGGLEGGLGVYMYDTLEEVWLLELPENELERLMVLGVDWGCAPIFGRVVVVPVETEFLVPPLE